MDACCYSYEITGTTHTPDCPVERVLRGNPTPEIHQGFVEDYLEKAERLENSPAFCAGCGTPITVPIEKVYCSMSCFYGRSK